MSNTLDLTLKPLEYSVNFAISLDPQTKRKVSTFEGKTISFDIKGLPFPVYITGVDNRLCFSFQEKETIQVCLRGSPFAFLRILVHKKPLQEFSSGELQLVGNSDLVEKLFSLFNELDVDWEELLSTIMGDAPAHSFYSLFSKSKTWTKKTIDSFFDNTSVFLQDEISIIAPMTAITDFIHDVDTLRDDVERLHARVHRLQNAFQHPEQVLK